MHLFHALSVNKKVKSGLKFLVNITNHDSAIVFGRSNPKPTLTFLTSGTAVTPNGLSSRSPMLLVIASLQKEDRNLLFQFISLKQLLNNSPSIDHCSADVIYNNLSLRLLDPCLHTIELSLEY